VTITGTESHPDKIEAVASPAEVEDVVEKIDSAIDNANKLVTKVVRSRRQAGPDVKNAEADERQRLQAELDQLAEKLSKPEYSR
jgi:DNA-binding PucR family transcriptional regulator